MINYKTNVKKYLLFQNIIITASTVKILFSPPQISLPPLPSSLIHVQGDLIAPYSRFPTFSGYTSVTTYLRAHVA